MPSFNTLLSYLTTGLVSVLVFGSVIFVHELGHFMAAKFSKIKVYEFAIGMGPTILSFTKKDTKYALRLFPIGGFVSMEGEDEVSDAQGSFTKASVGKRILVTTAGAIMNIILGFVILMIIVSMQKVIISRTIAEFNEGSITQQSGLQVGDTIVAVNGRKCYIANDLSYEFARTQNGVTDLVVMRDGKKVELDNVKFETRIDEQTGTNNLVIDFKVYPEKKTVFSVLKETASQTVSLARLVVLSLTDLISGRVAINNLSGPVGIVSAINEATSIGIEPVLMLLALITINLGIFNLLPLPALDGGRLVFLVIEAIRKKPLNQKYEIAINAAGFVVLICLMLFVTFNDITRLF